MCRWSSAGRHSPYVQAFTTLSIALLAMSSKQMDKSSFSVLQWNAYREQSHLIAKISGETQKASIDKGCLEKRGALGRGFLSQVAIECFTDGPDAVGNRECTNAGYKAHSKEFQAAEYDSQSPCSQIIALSHSCSLEGIVRHRTEQTHQTFKSASRDLRIQSPEGKCGCREPDSEEINDRSTNRVRNHVLYLMPKTVPSSLVLCQ